MTPNKSLSYPDRIESRIGGMDMEDGFALLDQNMKILYKALARAHIRQSDADYDDWLSFARLQYLYHYQKRGSLSDEVFNRGVGRLIYLDIEKQRGSIVKDLQRVSRVNEFAEESTGIDITELEVRELLQAAVVRMTGIQRQIFVLLIDEGLTQAQIARQLQISRQAVYGHVEKIRKIMSDVLGRE